MRWLEEKRLFLKLSTYKTSLSSVNYIISFFGDRFLDATEEADITAFRSELKKVTTLRGKAMSNKRINNINTLLKGMFSSAERQGLIKKHPMAFIKNLKTPKTDIDPMSFEEVQKFLAKVPKDYYAFFYTAFTTGMRPNELIALKWSQLDFTNKKICVREGRVLGEEGPPKTESSIRDIDMLQTLEEVLKEHKANTFLKSEYVFLNRIGRPIRIDNLRRRIWEPTLKRAGLKKRTLYQTRHTFASLALASGENPNWIAHQMGHTTTATLFKYYNRFVPNLTRQDGKILTAKFDDILHESPDKIAQKRSSLP